MSHLVGYISISYAKLVKTFGEPTHKNPHWKTQAEWEFADPPFRIYDWKKQVLPAKVTDWHIGGENQDISAISKYLQSKNISMVIFP